MAGSKKGHIFAILGRTEKKNMHSLCFLVLMLHIKFQGPTLIGLQDTVGT